MEDSGDRLDCVALRRVDGRRKREGSTYVEKAILKSEGEEDRRDKTRRWMWPYGYVLD